MSLHKQRGCPDHCDISHKIWLDNNPDDPIIDGEVIHHKDDNHDNNEDSNQEKMTHGKHTKWHVDKKHPKGMLGKVHSLETKQKMSIDRSGMDNAMFGKNHSENTKQKISKNTTYASGKNHHSYGKTLSEEHKRKISNSKIGKVLSEEHKKRLSIIKLGKNNPFYGKKYSEEARRKMSISKLSKNREVINA